MARSLLARAVEILRGVLSGLAHAHAAQISHGELKAENVLLADQGVLVADTGIASALGKPATPRNDMAAVQSLARECSPVRAYDRGRTAGADADAAAVAHGVDALAVDGCGRALAGMRPAATF